jgi:type VI secretion system protein ImpI
MELMLEIVSRHKFAPGIQSSHVFSEVGGVIGRSEACEWCLTDKSKRVSRQHALISCDGRHFYIEDKSSNGIYSPLTKQPLAKGTRHIIEHGESYLLGDYSIQARLLHSPDTYLEPDSPLNENVIPEDATLDLDPLLAMDQQDSFIAKQRLGLYNDLLGDTPKPSLQPSDHSEPRLDTLPSIKAIPENWADTPPLPVSERVRTAPPANFPFSPAEASAGGIPADPGDSRPVHPVNMFHPMANEHPDVTGAPVPSFAPGEPGHPSVSRTETTVFFEALGFSAPPESREERKQVLLQAAKLLHAYTEGMLEALHNRAETKNELRLPHTTVRVVNNNPLKFSPTAAGALEYLLGPKRRDMLSAAEAVRTSFQDLHAHNLGLLAGARAAVRGVLQSISPESLEAKLDAEGPVRVLRTARLWNTFIRMHMRLLHDNDGFAAFFFNDFTRAYTMQQHTLNPIRNHHLKGE